MSNQTLGRISLRVLLVAWPLSVVGCVLTSDTELNRPQQRAEDPQAEASDLEGEGTPDLPGDSAGDSQDEDDMSADSVSDAEVGPSGYRVVYARFSWPQAFSSSDDFRVRTNSVGFMASSESPSENEQYRVRGVHFETER